MAEKKPRDWIKAAIFIVIIILAIILSQYYGLSQRLGELRNWISGLGFLGYLTFILIYSVAVVFSIPASALTIAAGSLFGSLYGVIIVSIASTLGAGLSFLAARYFARDFVAGWLGKKDLFHKLENMTEKNGQIVVAITRLVPIFPFIFLNYAFGLTKIPFSVYIFWSWLCMIPGTILFVVGADAVTKGLAEGKIPWILVGVIAVAIAIITLLIRSAKKKLKE